MESILKFLEDRLTIRHLRMVIAIVDRGSLVGAAEQLHMTQSAVTKSLKEAESLLNLQLFERTNRGVVPTIYGDALGVHARRVIEQLRHASEEISELSNGAGGSVVVGTTYSASAQLLPRAISILRQRRPKLSVTILEGTNDALIQALQLGDVDLVVGRLPEFEGNDVLSLEFLFMDIACVVARPTHPLSGKVNLELSDLLGFDWVLPFPGTAVYRQFAMAFINVGLVPPPAVVQTLSILTARGLIIDADYLSVWSWQLAQSEVAVGRLVILPVALPLTKSSVGVVTRAGRRRSPAAEQLLRTLRTVGAAMKEELPTS